MRVKNSPFVILFVLITVLSSCITEDRDDCSLSFSFNYSYNVLEANAYHKQVDFIHLFLFDEEGVFIDERELKAPFEVSSKFEWDMPSDGKYNIVAWGQKNAPVDGGFVLPDLTVGMSRISDFNAYLNRKTEISNQRLGSLLIGSLNFTSNKDNGSEHHIIDFKKVTNTIRLLLVSVDDVELEADNYEIQLIDPIGNGKLDYGFNLLPDKPIVYKPYFQKNVIPKPDQVREEDVDNVNSAIVSELSTSKLVYTHHPRLVVKDKTTGKDVINTDVMKFVELLEINDYTKWKIQEYLDRQDTYEITLYIKEGTKWVDVVLIINGWVINNISIEG